MRERDLRHHSMKRGSGFTLIEVLVALVIVAVTLLALTRTAAQQVQTFDALRERTLAGWIASNVLTEKRMGGGLPATGRSDGQVRFANRNWRWRLDVQATPDARIRRLDVSVFLEQAIDPSVTLTGFAGEDLQP